MGAKAITAFIQHDSGLPECEEESKDEEAKTRRPGGGV
jgi:hypothetical protein